jgi:hypothetical protein
LCQNNRLIQGTGSLSDSENRVETKFLGQRFTNRGFSATVNQNSSQHNTSHYNPNDSRISTHVKYLFDLDI